MFRNCVRVLALGLLAAVSATAQRVNYTDISGHYIEFDLITLSVQTQVEAVLPVVGSLANQDINKLALAWSDNFREAVKSSTMSVQKNADSLNDFLAKAAKISPSFVSDAKTALSKAAVNFFKFHTFMPAATWDVVDYGVVRSNTPFNTTRRDLMKEFMTENLEDTDVDDLQELLDAYMANEEKQTPGFKDAVFKELNTAYKAVWTNNPTRAPTSSPSTTTPSVTSTSPTTTPTNDTSSTTSTTTTTNTTTSSTDSSTSTTTTSPTAVAPDQYIGEPVAVEESTTTAPAGAKTTPTPAPTKKSGGVSVSAASVVVSSVVVAVATALM